VIRRIPTLATCTFVLSTAACGARRGDNETKLPAVRETFRADAAPRCTIRAASATLPALRVDLGAEELELSVWGVPVEATPDQAGEKAHVSVRGPLEFDATIPSPDFPYRLGVHLVERRLQMVRATTGPEASAGSRFLRLGPGTELERVRARDGVVVADAVLARGLRAVSLAFPCDALTGDAAPAPAGSSNPDRGDGTHWRPRRGELEVFSEPGGEQAPLRILVEPSARSWFSLARTESRGAWMHVVWQNAASSALSGWVRASELEATHSEAPPDSTSCFVPDLVDCEPAAGEAGVYRGFAAIAAGTRVHSAPAGYAWATVRAGDAPWRVRHRDGEAWAAIVSLGSQIAGPGWKYDCREFEHAWVPASAVRRVSTAAPGPAPTGSDDRCSDEE
jgi:hypothetical protein